MKNNGSQIKIKLINLGKFVREANKFIINFWREIVHKEPKLLRKRIEAVRETIECCRDIESAYRDGDLTEKEKEELKKPLLESAKALLKLSEVKKIKPLNHISVYIIQDPEQQTSQAVNTAKEYQEPKEQLKQPDTRRAS